MVRMNFSHGTRKIIRSARPKCVRLRQNWAVMRPSSAICKAPKIRVSTFKEGKIFLNIGDKFPLDVQPRQKSEGDKEKVGIDYIKACRRMSCARRYPAAGRWYS